MSGVRRILAVAPLVWAIGCAAQRAHSTAPQPQARPTCYPACWWEHVREADAASWEILPQAAGPGEVIVSKRNELGLLSNFAATPFVFHGHRYASVEGFWQMMKYPESSADPRETFPGITWKHTREEVSQMVGFEAKAAGDLGTANMKAMGIDWVTFEGRRMQYWTSGKGDHYLLIVQAMREKVRQNENVRDILLSSGDLVLRPDHKQPPDAPPAWRYCEILMDLRGELRAGGAEPAAGRRWALMLQCPDQ
jgi:predicted NAD-dependent protein-ADP-ribosyltransferase YbiA (DUF1768 family)